VWIFDLLWFTCRQHPISVGFQAEACNAMDLSTIVNTIQIAIWIYVGIVYLRRKGKLGKDSVLKAAIVFGLIMSAFSLVLSYRNGAFPLLHGHTITITNFAFEPPPPEPLIIVSHKTFKDQDVPLDGYVYADSIFINVCLLYEGGAYQLQNATFQGQIKICSNEPRMKNHADLLAVLGMMKNVQQSERTVLPLRK
jgi:hypothetical protein